MHDFTEGRIRLRWLVSVFWIALLFQASPEYGNLRAQTPDDVPAASEPAPAVREAKPDIYYLKDGDKLQPVLGFTLDDFERMLLAEDSGKDKAAAPDFTIDKLMVSGAVNSTSAATLPHANLNIDLNITPRVKGWVRVPLRLGGAALGSAELAEGANGYVTFDAAASEYVAWLKGSSEPQRLKLAMLANVENEAGEYRLSLNLPRARSSVLVITTPSKDAIGKVSDGAILESTVHESSGTKFRVLGAGGLFVLNWRDSRARSPVLLEATGAVSIRIEGAAARSEARLTVRSFTGEFDRFRVRLPPRAELAGNKSEDYSVSVVSEQGAESERESGTLVEVILGEKSQGPVTVALVTQAPCDLAGSLPIEFGGFDVQNAVRQWGQVAVHVGSDWDVRWSDRRQVRQVDDLPAELRGEGLVGGFEFYAQPFSLKAHVVPRVTRVIVEPEYVVRVGPNRLTLDGKLRFQVRGAPVFTIDIAARGWTIEHAGPPELIDPLAIIDHKESDVLKIPLLKPLEGDAEVILTASRLIEPDSGKLEFQLPMPKADSPAGATLSVVQEGAIELTPTDEMPGLVSQRGVLSALGARSSAVYQYRADLRTARFSANIRSLPRSIHISVRSRVRVEESAIRVEQTFDYAIAHEPVNAVSLRMPREILDTSGLQILSGGQSLSYAVLEGPAEADGASHIRIALPSPVLERSELVVRYVLAAAPLAPGASSMIELPLGMPAEGELVANVVTLEVEEGLVAQSRSTEEWTAAPHSDDDGDVELRLSARSALAVVPLVVHRASEGRGAKFSLERGWIHSNLLEAGVRRERVLFRFRTGLRSIQLVLPTGATGVEATVDGDRVSLRAGDEGAVRILLRPDSDNASRLLELVYRLDNVRASGSFQLVPPDFRNAVGAPAVYWEIVLPRHRHLFEAPANFVPEHRWKWKGFYIGREPLLSQVDLERWIAVTKSFQAPKSANRYLFSTVASPAPLALRTASSSSIVLGGAGFALVLGLLGIYVPLLRRAPVLLGVGIALCCAVILFPETSVIVAQAALVGIVLTILAVWLERIETRRRWRSVSHAAPSSLHGSTRTPPRAIVAGSHSSTRTAFAGPPSLELEP